MKSIDLRYHIIMSCIAKLGVVQLADIKSLPHYLILVRAHFGILTSFWSLMPLLKPMKNNAAQSSWTLDDYYQ